MSSEKKPQRNWGQSQVEYLATPSTSPFDVAQDELRTGLEGKQVTVVFMDGKAMKGELTGVDTCEIYVQQSNGLEVMISNGLAFESCDKEAEARFHSRR
jgi:hypothetical protein